MKKWKLIVYLMIVIVLLKVTLPCKESYNTNENVVITDVIASDGLNAQCNISIYSSNNTLNQSGLMTQNGLSYNYNATKLSIDNYVASIECNSSGNYWYGECKFKVEQEETKMIAIMIGLTVVTIFFMLLWYFIPKYLQEKTIEEIIAPIRFIFLTLSYLSIMGILRLGIQLLTENGYGSFAGVFNVFWLVLLIVFSFVFVVLMFLYGINFIKKYLLIKRYGGDDF